MGQKDLQSVADTSGGFIAMTVKEKYGPAMNLTTEAEAQEYFEKLVEHTMSFGHTREEAEEIERSNLGYYAGYFGDATRERVEHLFACAHPIFGKLSEQGPPSPEEAFRKGMALGVKG